MTCRDIDELMSSARGNPARTPEAIGYLANWGNCRTLVRVLCEGEKLAPPPATQLKRSRDRIVDNLKFVRPLPTSRVFLSTITYFGIVGIGVTRFGMNGWSALALSQPLAIFTALAVSAVLLALSAIGQMVLGRKYPSTLASLRIELLTVLMIGFAACVPTAGRTRVRYKRPRLHKERPHILDSSSVSILAAGALRCDPLSELIGSAIGGLAALIGLSVLEISRSHLDLFYRLMWHWGVLLVSSVAGAAWHSNGIRRRPQRQRCLSQPYTLQPTFLNGCLTFFSSQANHKLVRSYVYQSF